MYCLQHESLLSKFISNPECDGQYCLIGMSELQFAVFIQPVTLVIFPVIYDFFIAFLLDTEFIPHVVGLFIDFKQDQFRNS
jgi:hypothetical protein